MMKNELVTLSQGLNIDGGVLICCFFLMSFMAHLLLYNVSPLCLSYFHGPTRPFTEVSPFQPPLLPPAPPLRSGSAEMNGSVAAVPLGELIGRPAA